MTSGFLTSAKRMKRRRTPPITDFLLDHDVTDRLRLFRVGAGRLPPLAGLGDALVQQPIDFSPRNADTTGSAHPPDRAVRHQPLQRGPAVDPENAPRLTEGKQILRPVYRPAVRALLPERSDL